METEKVQNDKVSMTLFSFDKGEEISTHAAAGDAMVTVLDGTGRFTVGGEVCIVTTLGGNVIVKVKESRVAVSDELARKIMV